MFALTFSALIFIYFFLSGIVLVKLLKFNANIQRKLIYFAPAISTAFHVIVLKILSQFGLNVAASSPAILILMTLMIGWLLKNFKGMQIEIRPILYIMLFTFMAYWPLIRYGFGWIGFGNGDAAYYSAGASYFANNSLRDSPDVEAFSNGIDYSQTFHYWYNESRIRFGSEILLAFTSIARGGYITQIFMPFVAFAGISLNLAIYGVIDSFTGISKKAKRIFILIISLSPMLALSVYSQLIAQIGGLLLSITVIFLFSEIYKDKLFGKVNLSILFTLLSAALIVWYSEITPYIFGPIGLVLLFGMLNTSKESRGQILRFCLINFLAILTILGPYFIKAIQFLANNLVAVQRNAIEQDSSGLFPYFLVPKGIPAIFGLIPLNNTGNIYFSTLLIIFAITLIGIIIYYLGVFKLWKNVLVQPFLVLSFFYCLMVYKENGFASYKTILFLQPFLIICLGAIINAWQPLKIGKLKRAKGRKYLNKYFIPLLLASGLQLSTLNTYALASTGERFLGFNELPGASRSNLLDQLKAACSSYRPQMGTLIATTSNTTISSYIATLCKGVPVIFLGQNSGYSPGFKLVQNSSLETIKLNIGSRFMPSDLIIEKYIDGSSSLDGKQYYLDIWNQSSVLNRSNKLLPNSEWGVQITSDPLSKLLPFNSKKPVVPLGSIEPNPIIPGQFMQSVEGSLLFAILGDTEEQSVLLEVSSTLLPQQKQTIPDIEIVANESEIIENVGKGSSRLLSRNLGRPSANQRRFLEINFSRPGIVFKKNPTSLFDRFYNKNISFDNRRISTFLQKASLVNGSDFIAKYSVTAMNSFSKDLIKTNVLYSGAYEDGWISEHSYFYLKTPSSYKDYKIRVKGQVPNIGNKNFISKLEIFINSQPVCSKVLIIGNFDIGCRISKPGTDTNLKRIEFVFSKTQLLPGNDGRQVGAYINSLGFTE